jgi:hypothetical protein
MKPLLLAGLLFLLLGACKKNSPDGALSGNWKLVFYTTGLSGRTIYAGPDSVCIISLQGDHDYRKSLNGNIYEFGTYSISSITMGSETTPEILFNGETGPLPDGGPGGPNRQAVNSGEGYQLNKDTLFLGWGVVDGGEFKYVRVR